MSESKEDKKYRLRKAILFRHRRNKGLCERCGLEGKHGDYCIEDYTQTDMRGIPSSPITVDLKKKKDTILSYRRKKNLCVNCGKERHDSDCNEDWNKSDNRTDAEKINRPAIVPTPKIKGPTILEELETRRDVDVFLEPKSPIKLQREFIVVNLCKSTSGNVIEFNCLNQMSRRFREYIICTIGDISQSFVLSEVMKIKKLINIIEIKPNHEQIIANYIGSCKKLFTFPDILYMPLCIKYNIPVFEFQDGKNATNFLSDEAWVI